MHYVRFLKIPIIKALSPPRISRLGFEVYCKIIICNDLGEKFLGHDLALNVFLQGPAEGGQIIRSKALPYMWKAGMRELEIKFDITQLSDSPFLRVGIGPYELVIAPNIPHGVSSLRQILSKYNARTKKESPLELSKGVVIPAYSNPLLVAAEVDTPQSDRRVCRKLLVSPGHGHIMKIYEDTGNSLARHIWDAGLILSSYISRLKFNLVNGENPNILDGVLYTNEVKYKMENGEDPQLMERVVNILDKENGARVLELGAGCGIVGITVMHHWPGTKMILSDLDDAKEIANVNLSQLNKHWSSWVNDKFDCEFQELNWEHADILPANLKQGDIDLILVSDCTYNQDTQPDLIKTISALALENPQVLILVAMKIRNDDEMVFFRKMEEIHLGIVDYVGFNVPMLGEDGERIHLFLYQRYDGVLLKPGNVYSKYGDEFWEAFRQ